MRFFFAKLEHCETKGTAPIDVILNKNRKQKKRKKRMTLGQQEAANERLLKALDKHQPQEQPYNVKLPRKFVRAQPGALLKSLR